MSEFALDKLEPTPPEYLVIELGARAARAIYSGQEDKSGFDLAAMHLGGHPDNSSVILGYD